MNTQEASKLISALADESRLQVYLALNKNGKLCAKDLLEFVSCKQATLSHHMDELVESGLVIGKKKGNKVLYSINNKAIDSLLNFLERKNKKEETPQIEEKVEEKLEEKTETITETIVEETKEEIRDIVPNAIEEEIKEQNKGPVSITLPFYLL